jgi:TPR repeat protein
VSADVPVLRFLRRRIRGGCRGAPGFGARARRVKNAEDMLIVDCLLPGQIRSLGRQATFMSARRPIRTSQADCQIRGGEYVSYDRANYQTALKVWLDQAMAGSAEAQNNVGEIYSKGLGTEPDYGMAAQWFKKAADQGYNRAKINLGFLYEQGLGVPQDTAMALNLYREGSGLQDELLYASEWSAVQAEGRADQRPAGPGAGAQASPAELREQVRQLQSQLAERRRALALAGANLTPPRTSWRRRRRSRTPAEQAAGEPAAGAGTEDQHQRGADRRAANQRAGGGSGGVLAAPRVAADPRSHLRGDARPQHRGGARAGQAQAGRPREQPGGGGLDHRQRPAGEGRGQRHLQQRRRRRAAARRSRCGGRQARRPRAARLHHDPAGRRRAAARRRRWRRPARCRATSSSAATTRW